MNSFMMPHLYHYITIYDKRTKQTTTEKHYSGGPQWGDRGETWWSTYRSVYKSMSLFDRALTHRRGNGRYQLEAFVDMVRGRQAAHWVTLDSSITAFLS